VHSGTITDISVYRSNSHPDGRKRRAVFGTAIVRPLGNTMLPVMIGTLVAMLQGYSVVSVLYIGFPVALLVASFWTWIRLRSAVCEILISDGMIALKSVYDAAEPSRGQQWKLLIDMHTIPSGLSVTVGLEQFELKASEWPNWSELLDHLESALLDR
jgi:hypothetical protein